MLYRKKFHQNNSIKKNPAQGRARSRKVKPEARKENKLEEDTGRWALKLARGKPWGAQGKVVAVEQLLVWGTETCAR